MGVFLALSRRQVLAVSNYLVIGKRPFESRRYRQWVRDNQGASPKRKRRTRRTSWCTVRSRSNSHLRLQKSRRRRKRWHQKRRLSRMTREQRLPRHLWFT